MKTSRTTRLVIAGLSLAAMAMPGLSLPADAAPTLPAAPVADPALIDHTATGSLQIHKFLGDSVDRPNDGTEIDMPADAVALPGVVFTASRVTDVDLTTNEGWQQATKYQRNLEEARAHLGETHTSAPTDEQGRTSIEGLPLGLYLVREVSVSDGGGDDLTVPRAKDFLVTVPMTDPASRTSWMYDIHVYPKNERLGVEKSVRDFNAGVAGEDAPGVGTVMTYQINADIPSDGLRAFGGACERSGSIDGGEGLDDAGFTEAGDCAEGATFNPAGAAYVIRDRLDGTVPGLDRPVSDFVEFTGAGQVVVQAGGRSLQACHAGPAPDCDYVLTLEPAAAEVALTGRGMMTARQAKGTDGDAVVYMSVQARVKEPVAEASTGGVVELPNTAELFPNGSSWESGTGVPSNEVVSRYGQLQVHKIAEGTEENLAGAVFSLYRTQEAARDGADPIAVSAPTDDAGMARFPGLHVTDLANNESADQSYWLVETTAPDGYMGLPGPIEVKLLSDGTTVGADESGGMPLPNRKGGVPGPGEPPHSGEPGNPGDPWTPWSGRLPNTGADVEGLAFGLIGLTGVGVVLIAAGRRRK